jgi:hypothetical protein
MGTPLWPTERARLDAAVTLARQSLNEEGADNAWMHGWTTSTDETLGIALDFLKELSDESAERDRPMRTSVALGGSSSISYDSRPSTTVK